MDLLKPVASTLCNQPGSSPVAEVLSVVGIFRAALCIVLTHESQMCFQLLLLAIRVCLQEEKFIVNFIWDHLSLAGRQQSRERTDGQWPGASDGAGFVFYLLLLS